MVDLVRLWWMTPTQTMHYHGEYVTLESPTTISYRLVSEFHHYFSRDSCSTIPGGLFFEWSAWLPGFLVQPRWWFQAFFFHPYDLGKIPILTNGFQMGWNHQPLMYFGGCTCYGTRCENHQPANQSNLRWQNCQIFPIKGEFSLTETPTRMCIYTRPKTKKLIVFCKRPLFLFW